MTEKHLHAEANFTEKMVKFARQLELYLAHFPSCHKYTLTQQTRRGANFVGFRTWRSARFVRPHVISARRRDARRGRLEGVVSRLGHARRTCSFRPMMTYLQEHQLAVYQQMPQSFKDVHTRQIACK